MLNAPIIIGGSADIPTISISLTNSDPEKILLEFNVSRYKELQNLIVIRNPENTMLSSRITDLEHFTISSNNIMTFSLKNEELPSTQYIVTRTDIASDNAAILSRGKNNSVGYYPCFYIGLGTQNILTSLYSYDVSTGKNSATYHALAMSTNPVNKEVKFYLDGELIRTVIASGIGDTISFFGNHLSGAHLPCNTLFMGIVEEIEPEDVVKANTLEMYKKIKDL